MVKMAADFDPAAARVPAAFLCPIMTTMFEDPVFTVDGHTYERGAILQWFRTDRRDPVTNARLPPTSPVTNLALPSLQLTPNWALKAAIAAYNEKGSEFHPRMPREQTDFELAVKTFAEDMEGKLRAESAGGRGVRMFPFFMTFS